MFQSSEVDLVLLHYRAHDSGGRKSAFAGPVVFNTGKRLSPLASSMHIAGLYEINSISYIKRRYREGRTSNQVGAPAASGTASSSPGHKPLGDRVIVFPTASDTAEDSGFPDDYRACRS
jgi:hypothetical protein